MYTTWTQRAAAGSRLANWCTPAPAPAPRLTWGSNFSLEAHRSAPLALYPCDCASRNDNTHVQMLQCYPWRSPRRAIAFWKIARRLLSAPPWPVLAGNRSASTPPATRTTTANTRLQLPVARLLAVVYWLNWTGLDAGDAGNATVESPNRMPNAIALIGVRLALRDARVMTKKGAFRVLKIQNLIKITVMLKPANRAISMHRIWICNFLSTNNKLPQ